jgi:predicted metal-dependent phosphoesterase TrpH
VLKVELHTHTDLDPSDAIPYSTRELIDHAARLQYQAIAVTLHDRYFDSTDSTDSTADAAYARDRGVTLISGIERTIGGKHVLLLNFSAACASVESFGDLATLKHAEPGGLVVAPHAMYPHPSAIGRKLLDRHADLIDALEVNALYTRISDFNRPAIAWARERGKPLVGNSDLHTLDQLGRTYSLVDAQATPDAICAAIRAGRVEVRTEPLSVARAGWVFGRMVVEGLAGRGQRLLGSRRD